MLTFNRVFIAGILGGKPELRYTTGGKAVTNFSVATHRRYTTQSGEKVSETDWHRVTAFGGMAEYLVQYGIKGDTVIIDGKVQTDKWTDKNGVSRTTQKVIATTVSLIKRQSQEQGKQSPSVPSNQGGGEPFAPTEDDKNIPF